MVVFPAISALITLACAGLIARDALARPRPDKIAWTIAFAIFAVAAGAEVVGSLASWTPALARTYYLAGAVLVVGYLALGELYLLAGGRIGRVAPGATLLVTAAAATIVFNAGVDRAKMADDGWQAIERGPALTVLAVGINTLGTAVIAGGLIYSAWRFKRIGTQRERMIGCLLIAVGTITVGSGGTLTRFGHREYLYIPMAIGAAIIFVGYLQTRRPITQGAARAVDVEPVGLMETSSLRAVTTGSPGQNGRAKHELETALGTNGRHVSHEPARTLDPGNAFIETQLSSLDDEALSELCRVWSVERPDVEAFQRDEARRAWELRTRLSVEGQSRFDALPVAVRLQVTTLYHEVMTSTPSSAGNRS